MRGIVLAGGAGSRLYPITKGVSKHLLPIYDKPMIYYPISVLMLAGIKEILIITNPDDLVAYKRLLGDGSEFGVCFSYLVQPSPDGLAQAFILAEEFIANDEVCLVLGDNIFYGQGFPVLMKKASENLRGATIFGFRVKDPDRYGVVSLDQSGLPTSIEEKPLKPKTDIAVTGLYFYDKNVVEIAKGVKPSRRGELEITSINQAYLHRKQLNVELLGRGFTWLDSGTHESLLEASNLVKAIENRQGFKIACLEEIGLRNNWLDTESVRKRAIDMPNTAYGRYLFEVLERYKC